VLTVPQLDLPVKLTDINLLHLLDGLFLSVGEDWNEFPTSNTLFYAVSIDPSETDKISALSKCINPGHLRHVLKEHHVAHYRLYGGERLNAMFATGLITIIALPRITQDDSSIRTPSLHLAVPGVDSPSQRPDETNTSAKGPSSPASQHQVNRGFTKVFEGLSTIAVQSMAANIFGLDYR